MNPLRLAWLAIISASAALLGFLATVLMLSRGYGSPVLPSSSAVTLLAVGMLVLALGILVWWDKRRLEQDADRNSRENRERKDDDGTARGSADRGPADPYYRRPARRLHPLDAVRVVAAGQACAYAGSLIAGWHAGVLLDLAPAAGMAAPNANSSLVMIIGGLVWVIIGFVVEQLCRLPPDRGGTSAAQSAGEDLPDQEHGPLEEGPNGEEGYARTGS